MGKKETTSVLLDRMVDSLSYYLSSTTRKQEKSEKLVNVVSTRSVTHKKFDDAEGISKITITNYIKNLAINSWGLKKEPVGMTWHLGYKGKDTVRVFDAYLTVTKQWTYFQVPILAERVASVLLTDDIQAQALFLKYLLKLNLNWFVAKIGIGEENQIFLQVEAPTEALDFPLLRFLARTVATYLDRYAQEIEIMASLQNDQQLSDLLQETTD
jgi:hypothetical protein